ncbi:MAG: hypothetical protein U0514_00820 [Candidatus Andersenbacteria bacterium]
MTLSNDGARLWVTAGTTTGEVRSLNPSTLAQTDTITPAGAASGGTGILGDQLNPPQTRRATPIASTPAVHVRRPQQLYSGSITSSAYVAGPWALANRSRPAAILTSSSSPTVAGAPCSAAATVYEYDGALGPAQTRAR